MHHKLTNKTKKYFNSFDEYMEEFDQSLNSENFPIESRELLVLTKISQDIGLDLSKTEQEKISNWYEVKYGDRLKMKNANYKIAILISNVPYLVSFPMFVFGTFAYNPFEFIEDFSPNLIKSLSYEEKEHIALTIKKYFEIFLNSSNLIYFNYPDLSTAVDNIISPRGDYGLSKWSSLQLAEKALKKYLKEKESIQDPPKTHVLNKLTKLIKNKNIDTTLLNYIQCNATVRYGEESVTLNEAIKAHHASIELCYLLTK